MVELKEKVEIFQLGHPRALELPLELPLTSQNSAVSSPKTAIFSKDVLFPASTAGLERALLSPHLPHAVDVFNRVADFSPQILLVELHLNSKRKSRFRFILILIFTAVSRSRFPPATFCATSRAGSLTNLWFIDRKSRYFTRILV